MLDQESFKCLEIMSHCCREIRSCVGDQGHANIWSKYVKYLEQLMIYILKLLKLHSRWLSFKKTLGLFGGYY